MGFDAPADISGTWPDNSGIMSGTATPTLDASVKASGVSALKFTIPSNSAANSSGSYYTNFSVDRSVLFGENAEFYIQWRQRFSREFLAGAYAGGGGWKQVIIGTGDAPGGAPYSSCTALETVVQNIYHRGLPQMYNSCTGSASHGAYDPFERNNGIDITFQNARPAPYCLYGQVLTGTQFPPTGNCFGYFPDEWMTFQVRIRTGPRVGDEFVNSYVTLWVARENQPSELVMDFGPYNLSAGDPLSNQKFGKIWLLPYNTGKDPSVSYPTAYTWYDELIISRARIADPTPSTDNVAPSPPTGLRATAAAGQISLAWNASTDNVAVAGYRILRGGTQIGTSTSTTFINSGLAPGATYSYAVTAFDAAGNVSSPSAPASATTPAPAADTSAPSVPSGLAATAASSSQIDLAWQASTDNVGVAGYEVHRNGTFLAGTTGTTFSSTQLAAGTTYTYAVRAFDAANNFSALSPAVSATTPAGAPAAQRTGPIVAYNFDEASGFVLRDRSGNAHDGTLAGGSAWAGGKHGGAISFDGLNAQVRADHAADLSFGNGGEFTVSAWVYVRDRGKGILFGKQGATGNGWRLTVTPSGRLVLEGNGTERFSVFAVASDRWQHLAAVQSASGVALYVNGTNVTSSAGSNGNFDNNAPLTLGTTAKPPLGDCCQRFFDGLLDDLRIYNRALTQAEIKADMNTPVPDTPPAPSPLPVPDTQAPTAPTGLTASVVSDAQINLSWQAATDNVGVTLYRVYRDDAQIGASSTTNMTHWGLAANTTYRYTVRAVDAAGNVSPPSAMVAATTAPKPGYTPPPSSADTQAPTAPSGLAASAVSPSQINLSWQAAIDNVGVTGYRVFQGADQVGTSATTSFAHAGLAANTTQSYTVRAVDAAGNVSQPSAVAVATTPAPAPAPAPADMQAPTAPANLTASAASTSQINLAWQASTDNVAVTGYRVFRDGAQIGISATTSFAHTGLTASTTYSYTVRAIDAAGNVSAASAAASATTPALPPSGGSSPLAQLAASLQPGQWASLVTQNINPTLTNTGGASNAIFGYSDAMKWDPVSRRTFYLGGDHGGNLPTDPNSGYRFVSYSEDTNSWSVLPMPPWVPGGSMWGKNDVHGYDKTAINPQARRLYRNPWGSRQIRVYDINAGTWSVLPDGPNTNPGCCDAIEYVPELNGVVWSTVFGQFLFNETTRQWSTLGTDLSLGGTWMFAEYNPVHRVTILGSASGAFFKLSSSGQLTPLRNMPVSVYNGSAWNGVVTVDPVSGEYLIVTPITRQLHAYNVLTDTWRLVASPPPVPSENMVLGTPISNYGVVMFTHCNDRGSCGVWLYKHAAQ